jgi:hypothetical protein
MRRARAALGLRPSLGLLAAAALVGALSAPGAALSEQETTAEKIRRFREAIAGQKEKLHDQGLVLDEQRRTLDMQRRLLDKQQRELRALEARMENGETVEAGSESEAPSDLPSVSQGAGADQPAPPSPRAPKPVAPVSPQEVEEEEPALAEAERPRSRRPLEQLLLEAGAVLLPRGVLQIEPSLEYSHFSNSAVAISGFTIFDAIVIGTISVDRLDRDIFRNVVTARYGLFDRVQLETRVPLVFQRTDELLQVGTTDEEERTVDSHGLGDIEATISWQAMLGRRAVPHLVLNLRARFPTGEDPFGIDTERVGTGAEVRLKEPPTGSGFYSIGPGFSTLWRNDPVVFFFGGNYNFNLERDQGSSFGDIDPGDQVEAFVGMNVALSERVALNFSFVDTQTFDTKQNGRTIEGSSFNDARLLIGASVGLSPHTSLLFTAAAGLTDQSPDFQFTVRVPITFQLFGY